MWEQIRSNQLRSVMLVALLGGLLLFLGFLLGAAFVDNGVIGIIIALIVWGMMVLIAYFQGDSILLSIAGAKKITRDDHPRLYNIVEEMKIASGLEVMPDIYIIDDPAMNAFATGRGKDRAAVAVTTGLLQSLNRDELQGVIGHEIAHIKNRDVLLMAMCSVLLGTIVILAWYGTRFLIYGGMVSRSSSRRSGGGQAQLFIIIVALLLAIIAPIAAQLLYFAISRRREYLADACSALYTRYPEGLASALEKIAASPKQLRSANKATAPMYIINPFRSRGRAASDLTSTHPPISERIRILRSMAGASFADYDRAYREVKRHSIIPQSSLKDTAGVPLRAASAVAESENEIIRTRQTSDAVWRANRYRIVDCPCGVRLKIPPDFGEETVTCPRCGEEIGTK
ncbi:MAG: M48 family metallopeptidase [Dehalococcoidales bacterium]|nr:M48 family metallopeptidase [Dehalococcoidales bacterium]